MNIKEFHDSESEILTKEDVDTLKNNGFRLNGPADDDKTATPAKRMYVLKFLYNLDYNIATNPLPFKVDDAYADTFAKKAIGTHWIVPPKFMNTGTHLNGTHEGKEDTMEDLLEIQRKYSIGVNVVTFKNENTNNYYGVYSVFPEHQSRIEKKEFPISTSFTVGNPVFTKEGVMKAGEFLNIQTVKNPSYPPRLVNIQPVCGRDLQTCVTELRTAGAASVGLALNTISQGVKAMEEAELIAKVDESVKAAVEPLTEKVDKVVEMEKANADILKEVAAKTEGVDETKVITDGDAKEPEVKAAVPPMPDTAGAAVQQVLKELQNVKETAKTREQELEELKAFKTAQEKKDKEAADKLRLEAAKKLAAHKISIGKADKKDFEKLTKSYVALKDDKDNLVNLDLMIDLIGDSVPTGQTSPETAGAGVEYHKFDIEDTPNEASINYLRNLI